MNATINILAQAAKTESGSGSANPLGSPIIMMVLMFVVFWVILIRPQQKQRKALAAKQAAGTFVKYDKSAIATVIPSGSKSDDDQSGEVSKG